MNKLEIKTIKLAMFYGTKDAGESPLVAQYMKLHNRQQALYRALSGSPRAELTQLKPGDLLYNPKHHGIYKVTKVFPDEVQTIRDGGTQMFHADRLEERSIRRISAQAAAAVQSGLRRISDIWDKMSTEEHKRAGRLTGTI